MATLIKGLLSLNLDWVYVLVGVFFSVTMELCGVKALSFAVGLYLPLSTTLPIFAGGVVKGLVDVVAEKKGGAAEDSELGGGSLMATGLVAGGALTGVVVALLNVNDAISGQLEKLNLEPAITGVIGHGGFTLLGVAFFVGLGVLLYRASQKPAPTRLMRPAPPSPWRPGARWPPARAARRHRPGAGRRPARPRPAARRPASTGSTRPPCSAMDADEAARRLGSFEWAGTASFTVTTQADSATRVHVAERHRVRQSANGEFEVDAEIDEGRGPGGEAGKHVVFGGGLTYARAQFAPWRERPTDHGRDARRFRDESFTLAGDLARLQGPALVLTAGRRGPAPRPDGAPLRGVAGARGPGRPRGRRPARLRGRRPRRGDPAPPRLPRRAGPGGGRRRGALRRPHRRAAQGAGSPAPSR